MLTVYLSYEHWLIHSNFGCVIKPSFSRNPIYQLCAAILSVTVITTYVCSGNICITYINIHTIYRQL